jgi:hypothetical protein
MRPETEGKIMVVLIISLIAFGCGSGVGIVIGISQNDTSSPFSLNYSQDDPQFPSMTPASTSLENNSASSSDSNNNNGVYVDNTNNNTNNSG